MRGLAPRQDYPLDHASHIPILVGLAQKFTIRRVLELGTGAYSTPLFLNRDIFADVVEVVSVEQDAEWRAKAEAAHGGKIQLTDVEPTDRTRFDLIFIDSGHAAQRIQTLCELAATPECKALIVVHDAEYPPYRQEMGKIGEQYDFTTFNPETSVVWHRRPESAAIYAKLAEIAGSMRDTLALFPNLSPTSWALPDKIAPAPVARLTVSVAMASYKRHVQLERTLQTFLTQTRLPDEIIVVEDGYDLGATEAACRMFADRLPVRWICRRNRPDIPFSNAAIPRNIGIKAATGDILVIQNPEVRFTKPTDFANIVAPTEADPMICTCAPCMSLNEDGSNKNWYCDPSLTNFNHFAAAFRRAHLVALGGFDETFQSYG